MCFKKAFWSKCMNFMCVLKSRKNRKTSFCQVTIFWEYKEEDFLKYLDQNTSLSKIRSFYQIVYIFWFLWLIFINIVHLNCRTVTINNNSQVTFKNNYTIATSFLELRLFIEMWFKIIKIVRFGKLSFEKLYRSVLGSSSKNLRI